ncbi:FtsX-like permease family protein [Caecibacteroides pullorum]|uniref:ABC transporter permease n=1 Tax=Caecibacteroides pullorum TaxID=2725562 RepID=A0AA40ZTA8_9BACT|nr:FtsX-like permease family protein [Caecibacteroides pullorum]MBM6857217.1 ABC transporter permease [Caecibacteroides pullorum]MBV8058222.1 FtsX-like permease family protein [Caecibacteroides pullorum]
MILHYLKIAWRNLLKYRMQTAINVAGLAVGFACFAFANLWMRYEASFDSRYEAADRMYLLYAETAIEAGGLSPHVPYPVSTLLKQEFPEVEAACAFTRYTKADKLELEGQPEVELPSIQLDSCFMNLFGIRVLAGTNDFLYTNGQIALTERTARRLFGTTDVLGRTVTCNDEEVTVCAIVSDLPHSNFSFGFICEGAYFRKWQDVWYNAGFEVVVRLAPGVSPQALEEKFRAYAEQTDDRYRKITGRLRLMPLSEVRQAPFNEERLVSFSYLVLFAAAGGLVILCSLFNHLALFLSRMDIRRRELALRCTCGSSGRGLFAMLTTEYSLLVLLSGFLGFMLVELLQPSFQRLSGVEGNVYGESLLYFLMVLALSLVLLLPFVFRYSSLRPDRSRSGRRLKAMVGLQLFISLLAIFCTVALMKQLNYLQHTDLGWERRNIAAFTFLYPDNAKDEIVDRVRQMPFVSRVLTDYTGLLPEGAVAATSIDWEGKPEGLEIKNMRMACMDDTLASFYGIRLAAGKFIRPNSGRGEIMLNESAVRVMGIANPVGMTVTYRDKRQATVIGVVRDLHITAPTIPIQPTLYVCQTEWIAHDDILLKYHEGAWPELRHRVDSLFAKDYPEVHYRLVNVMDEYNAYLKAEHLLMRLLAFVSTVCILVSAFGIFSMITLSCERRRKEVAIRKVNGARVGDILGLFAREYLLLLAAAAVVAFPVGYVLMKRWLESYVEQTPLSWWLYAVIFLGMALLVALCIGWRVWRAANENPAEVVKRE